MSSGKKSVGGHSLEKRGKVDDRETWKVKFRWNCHCRERERERESIGLVGTELKLKVNPELNSNSTTPPFRVFPNQLAILHFPPPIYILPPTLLFFYVLNTNIYISFLNSIFIFFSSILDCHKIYKMGNFCIYFKRINHTIYLRSE